MKIKNATGWFAAGNECQRALSLLSDGAFRLYFHICAKAFRSTGVYPCTYDQLAKEINRSRRSVAAYVDELRRKSVCKIQQAVNQHENTEIEVCEEFWPYEKNLLNHSPNEHEFIQSVRQLISERPCIKSHFGVPEQQYARSLQQSNVSVEQIRRAVHLGCARKYASFLNNRDGHVVTTLLYFRDVIEEVISSDESDGYWQFKTLQMTRLERKWLSSLSVEP